ncbi:TadE/TadG family type IV pilus assembly protein [Tranquillimonas alkanivorans]|nr:TadE/TadG family type IV pilus assembly protein [Tranquillimonas alkanivorans]
MGTKRRLRRFGRDESGATMIFCLFIFVMMILAGGMTVDFMRLEDRRVHMQATLDRALLAAADLDQVRPAEEVVFDFLAREGFAEDNVAVEVNEHLAGRTVSARVLTETPTFFLHMIGMDTLAVSAGGQAREEVPHVEISLVLDISGSMRWNGRIDYMKDAAKNFVSSVLDQSVDDRVSINVIPYAGQTNPGPLMFDYLGGERPKIKTDYFPEWGQDISNVIVYFDESGDGRIDAAAKIDGFPDGGTAQHVSNDLDDFFGSMVEYIGQQDRRFADAEVIGASIKGGNQTTRYYHVADTPAYTTPTDNNGRLPYYQRAELSYVKFDADEGGEELIIDSSCIELGEGDFDYPGMPNDGSYDQVPHFMYWDIAASVMDWGWCPEDDTAIQYARQDEAELHDFIDGIRMHDGTGTHYAMKYALALLDPETRGAFEHLAENGLVPQVFSDRPHAWEDEETAKYIVLMTDGEITEQYRPTDPWAQINWTRELAAQPGHKRDRISEADENVASFFEACDLSKAHGVTVFTIAYETSAAGEDEMQRCASSASHFFDVDGLDIADAFSAIAARINQLRLTQ